ncbi:MAG: hypothetical protein C5B57_10230, partial [Blastocatellia bacterium]
PDLVILCSEVDDGAACQLLSMLKNDRDVSGIPVVTWTRRDANEIEQIVADVNRDWSGQAIANRMN